MLILAPHEKEMNIVKKRGSSRFPFVWIAATALWWGAVSLPARSAAEERVLKVVSSATGLTVEAHDVGVEEVLREIGEQVGFTVVVKEAARPVLNVSVKDVTLDEALQEILRGENYAILYPRLTGEGAPATGRMGKIMLLSPSNATAAAANATLLPRAQERRQALPPGQENTHSPAEASPADQATAAVFSKDGWKLLTGKEGENSGTSPTVANLLETQALQALAAQPGSDAGADADSENLAETAQANTPGGGVRLGDDAQMDLNRALLITTQAAQRNLTALVEGLSAATNSMFNAQAGSGDGGH